MKRFRRLTKEELDAVRPEFVRYLASEGIAADDWTKKQANQDPDVVACIDEFSERFWEGATSAIQCLEHTPSKGDVWMFEFHEESAQLIRYTQKGTTTTWSEGGKTYEPEARGQEIFQLLEQGAKPCDPERFKTCCAEMEASKGV
tara:strand:+ start:2401 stop:2835 length:435 start_codon:yes stop_codon:yes gene_type:complete